MKWLESTGGPLILIPKWLAPEWRGSLEVGDGCDYTRACAVSDYIGNISVGGGNALILGDAPDSTSILETPLGLAVLRWKYADSEEYLLNAVRAELDRAEVVEELDCRVEPSEYLLFDSAFPGAEFEDCLELRLESGTYNVRTRLYEGQDVGFLAHIFQKS